MDIFLCVHLLVDNKVAFSFVVTNVGRVDIVCLQQSFLDISERDWLFLFNRDIVDHHFEVIVRISVLWVLGGLAFFLRLELRQVFQFLDPEALLIRTKLDVLRSFDSIDYLLGRSDAHFLDFVTFEKEINLHKMLGIGGDFLVEK